MKTIIIGLLLLTSSIAVSQQRQGPQFPGTIPGERISYENELKMYNVVDTANNNVVTTILSYYPVSQRMLNLSGKLFLDTVADPDRIEYSKSDYGWMRWYYAKALISLPAVQDTIQQMNSETAKCNEAVFETGGTYSGTMYYWYSKNFNPLLNKNCVMFIWWVKEGSLYYIGTINGYKCYISK